MGWFQLLALTRKADYALVALAMLSKSPAAISARTLAERAHLPHPVLRNLLKQLARGGLLHSTQGTSGGYTLARPASSISIAEVVRLIDGPVRIARCCPIDTEHGETEPRCRLEDSCMIKSSVRQLHDTVMRVLAGVSIAHIADQNVPDNPLAAAIAKDVEIITRRPSPSSPANVFSESA